MNGGNPQSQDDSNNRAVGITASVVVGVVLVFVFLVWWNVFYAPARNLANAKQKERIAWDAGYAYGKEIGYHDSKADESHKLGVFGWDTQEATKRGYVGPEKGGGAEGHGFLDGCYEGFRDGYFKDRDAEGERLIQQSLASEQQRRASLTVEQRQAEDKLADAAKLERQQIEAGYKFLGNGDESRGKAVAQKLIDDENDRRRRQAQGILDVHVVP